MVKAETKSVRELFSRIAPYYDRGNRVISLGRDRAWRRQVARTLDGPGAGLLLDLATGTGELAREAAARGWRVVAADFCSGMIARGRPGAEGGHDIRFLLAEASTLPFKDGSFAAVSMGFGLRHMLSLPRLFREVWRVLEPGGRFLSLELTPPRAPWAPLQRFYLSQVMPVLGFCVTGDWGSYRCLPASLAGLPRADEVGWLLEEAGFRDVRYRHLGLGVAALHSARK